MKSAFFAVLLIFIGISLIVIGLIPYFQNVTGGAIIFIGPIPILIGFGASFEILLLLLIIAIIAFILLTKAIF